MSSADTPQAETAFDRLESFARIDRERFVIQDNNKFNIAFGGLVVYRRFLEIIAARHLELATRFLRNSQLLHDKIASDAGPRKSTDDEIQLYQEGAQLGMELRLETESFYLFAKIMLDRVARFVEFYFGPVRRCSLDSHDDLVKGVERYADALGLTLQRSFLELAKALKVSVADYRDYQISHEKSPRRIRGHLYQLGKPESMRMMASMIYPNKQDVQVESDALPQLLTQVDHYLEEFLFLLTINRARTRLSLQS